MKRPDPADFTGRDLYFRRADPAGAATLNEAQVAHYNVNGFISGIDVFDQAESARTRDYIDELLDAVRRSRDGRDSYSINNYHPNCAGLWDLATEARIVAIVADVIGREAVCWGTHLFAKLPGDGKEVPFHQDAIYWPFEPAKTATVWLAIDDIGPDNAPMQFVPGSHRAGPIAHEILDLDGTRVLGRRALGMDRWTNRFSNELRSGQVSIHSDLLLHGSAANASNRRRAGLTLRYAAADVRLVDGYDEWRRSAVHVLDGDRSGYWANRPRPDGERPQALVNGYDGRDPPIVDVS
jgi:hypothetical protein